jgi:hypothetical protein
MNSSGWWEFLLSFQFLKYVIAGSIARSFADNKAIGKTGRDFMRFAVANAILATAVSAVVRPLSAELGFNTNWQNMALFFAGYLGIGFLDIVQAKLRFAITEKGGKANDDSN